MARPRIELDVEQIERLAEIYCTDEEIAFAMGCSVDTLTRRFAEHIKKGKAACRRSLRRMQYEAAQAGNTGMMIWLGKQLLGQAEKLEHTGTVVNKLESLSDAELDQKLHELESQDK